LEIPNLGAFNLEVAVFDFNGTLALDGQIIQPVKALLQRLAEDLEIHVLTSDTFGMVVQQCQGLSVCVRILDSTNHTREKAAYLEQFGKRQVVAVGNGANDQLMLGKADLGIAVIGPEGCSSKTILSSDLVVNNIVEAIDLLLNPKRIVAGLRR
jgi:P-type E1-E2 ATPase